MSNDTQPEIRFPGFTDDWEQRKLRDVSNYSNGGSYESDVENRGKYELITLKSVDMFGNLVSSGKFINKKVPTLNKGTLVMILSEQSPGLLGMTAQIPKDDTFVLNQRVAEIHPNDDTNGYFLSMAINRSQAYFSKRGAGTKVQNISKSNVENFEFFIPIKHEQQKIGTFFKNLDDTIALHQRKLDLLKETKKGFLQKMFPGKGETVPKLRFAGFEGDWEERKLGSIYDFSKGKGLPLNSFTYSKDDPAIAYGHLYTKYSEVISEVYLSSDDDGVLSKDNDLLFPGSSTVPNGTAQANAITLNNVKLGGDIIIARPKQDTRVLSIFMSYQINSQRQKLFPITVGTTITHMYGKDLSKVKFFITNYSEQEKISGVFKQLDDIITLHQRELDLLKKTKKGFLQKMFV
ncbi:TPA: restriction endonuclease subunit S [Enterococcus faecalis]